MKEKLGKALDGMVGESYIPVAYLESQIVAGTNYAILCRVSPMVSDAESSYALVYLYVDLDGNAELTETADFTAEEDAGIAQIPNPFVDYSSLEDAAKVVGFELAAPDHIDGFSEKVIQVMNTGRCSRLFTPKAMIVSLSARLKEAKISAVTGMSIQKSTPLQSVHMKLQ